MSRDQQQQVHIHMCGIFSANKHVSFEDYRALQEQFQKMCVKHAGAAAGLECAQESLEMLRDEIRQLKAKNTELEAENAALRDDDCRATLNVIEDALHALSSKKRRTTEALHGTAK